LNAQDHIAVVCLPVEAAMLLTYRTVAALLLITLGMFLGLATLSGVTPMSGFKDGKSATVGDFEQLR
jgi:hypothetical protein